MTVNQLARAPAELQAPQTPFCASWLQRLRRGLGTIANRPALTMGMEPTEAERAQIPVLTSTLKRQITAGPADRTLIAAEIAKLLTAFPRQDTGDSELSLRIDAYFEAVGDAPAWAVQQARLRIIRGEVGSLDTRFAPNPPQVAAIVRDLLSSLRNDLADLERLSAAVVEHVPTPEERERVVAGFDKLRKTLGAKGDDHSHEDALKSLEALRLELGLPPDILDTIPDAKERTGTFRRPASLKREEAA